MADAPDQPPCPSQAALAAFLCAELPPAAMDEIGSHVSSCHHCDAAVRRMDEATDASLKELRKHLQTGDEAPPTNPEYHRMMAAAHAFSPTRKIAGPVVQNVPPPTRIGQYRIGERLGQGGMGSVYRAEHVRLKKKVAIKILSGSQMFDPRAVARFQLEMEVVGRLDHPNIVRATDAGEADGIHFLVMELIDGVNLTHLLFRCGPLQVPEVCELIRQAAIGLQHAYEHGLVHRDVKPSNLMLSTNGQVKLLDLGLALLRASVPSAGDLTGIGEVMGTAEYMAPEQWAETHSVDIRADIYSLGCTLYALLTGDPPFTGSGRKSFLRMMSAHQQEPVRPVTELRSDVPAALCALLDRMLAKNPEARPATPAAVAAELEHLAAGADLVSLSAAASPNAKTVSDRPGVVNPTPTPTPPRPSTTPPAPAVSRSRRRVLAAALAVVALVVGVSIFAAIATGPRGAAPPNEEPRADPKGWRNLLTQRPTGRLWSPSAVLDYNPDKEFLSIHSSPQGLLRLGDAPARGYKVQVGFRQTQWHGGIGVYFGGREHADPHAFVFQLIHLRHTKVKQGEFGLVRAHGAISLAPGAQPEAAVHGFQTTYLAPPDNEEHLLELEVKPNGLSIVRWNGVACQELVGEKAIEAAGKLFPDPHLTGEFGIYCNGASVLVTTARYVPTE
jgi:eukaryotic-like serine/threonine-protein kinase